MTVKQILYQELLSLLITWSWNTKKAKMVSAMSEKDIKDAFCVIDIDGDGTITLDELRYILTNMSTVESFSGNELLSYNFNS